MSQSLVQPDLLFMSHSVARVEHETQAKYSLATLYIIMNIYEKTSTTLGNYAAEIIKTS